jgi:PknH-like protein
MSVSRRCCAVLAIAAAAAAGCTTTVAGHHEPGDAARQATDLNALLLTADEIGSAMNATDMAVDTTMSTLVDDSPNNTPEHCLAVSSIGEEHVYAGSNWSAVRMQSLHEPGEDYAHLAQQAVVEFPTGADAAAFYTKSVGLWRSCAPGRYTYTPSGVTWDVGQVDDNAGMLIASTSQQGEAWLCLRALTAAAAIVVDILTCSDDPTGALAAQRIARAIASRVAGQ